VVCGVPDLLKLIEVYPYPILNDIADGAMFSAIIKSIFINDYVIRNAYKKNLDQSPEFKVKLANQKYLLLDNIYEQREIDNSISTDTSTLKTYYEENKNKAYLSLPTYEVYEIYIKDKQKAERILKLAQKTNDFKNLSDKNTERFLDRPSKGYLGFINENQYSRIGKAAKITKVGTVHPELIPAGKGFSIIEVTDTKEAEPIPFDKIMGRVRYDYKNERHQQLKEEILEKIKNKYPYKVNFSLLNQHHEVTSN
jgi:parvulin-like peptidyl-prolyl isomerase